MWRVPLAVLLVVALILGYEAWAVRNRPDLTITALIKRYTHLALIIGVPVLALAFGLIGYALHIGGC